MATFEQCFNSVYGQLKKNEHFVDAMSDTVWQLFGVIKSVIQNEKAMQN